VVEILSIAEKHRTGVGHGRRIAWPYPTLRSHVMSPEAQATLREIVAVARAGKEFYEYACMVVRDPVLCERLARMGQCKSDVIALIASRLSHAPPPGRARREFHAEVMAELARLREALGASEPAALLRELERIEESVIYHYTWQLAGSADSGTRQELGNLLPVLQRCREELAPPAAPRPSAARYDQHPGN
jgi:hypothetical protein